jgi:hypothetical protein
MIEHPLEVGGGEAAVFEVGQVRDGAFAAIRVSLAEIKVGRRQTQKNTGEEQVAAVAVLEQVQFLLIEVAFDFEAGTGALDPEVDIEAGGRAGIFANQDGILEVGVLGRKVKGVQGFRELTGAVLGGVEADAIDFDVALERIDVEGGWGADPTVVGEMLQAADTGLDAVISSFGFDEEMAEVIEADSVMQGVIGGRFWVVLGVERGGAGGGQVMAIQLLGKTLGIGEGKGGTVEIDLTIGVDMERLGLLDDAAGDPFMVVDLKPGTAGFEQDGLATITQLKGVGMTRVVVDHRGGYLGRVGAIGHDRGRGNGGEVGMIVVRGGEGNKS